MKEEALAKIIKEIKDTATGCLFLLLKIFFILFLLSFCAMTAYFAGYFFAPK